MKFLVIIYLIFCGCIFEAQQIADVSDNIVKKDDANFNLPELNNSDFDDMGGLFLQTSSSITENSERKKTRDDDIMKEALSLDINDIKNTKLKMDPDNEELNKSSINQRLAKIKIFLSKMNKKQAVNKKELVLIKNIMNYYKQLSKQLDNFSDMQFTIEVKDEFEAIKQQIKTIVQISKQNQNQQQNQQNIMIPIPEMIQNKKDQEVQVEQIQELISQKDKEQSDLQKLIDQKRQEEQKNLDEQQQLEQKQQQIQAKQQAQYLKEVEQSKSVFQKKLNNMLNSKKDENLIDQILAPVQPQITSEGSEQKAEQLQQDLIKEQEDIIKAEHQQIDSIKQEKVVIQAAQILQAPPLAEIAIQPVMNQTETSQFNQLNPEIRLKESTMKESSQKFDEQEENHFSMLEAKIFAHIDEKFKTIIQDLEQKQSFQQQQLKEDQKQQQEDILKKLDSIQKAMQSNTKQPIIKQQIVLNKKQPSFSIKSTNLPQLSQIMQQISHESFVDFKTGISNNNRDSLKDGFDQITQMIIMTFQLSQEKQGEVQEVLLDFQDQIGQNICGIDIMMVIIKQLDHLIKRIKTNENKEVLQQLNKIFKNESQSLVTKIQEMIDDGQINCDSNGKIDFPNIELKEIHETKINIDKIPELTIKKPSNSTSDESVYDENYIKSLDEQVKNDSLLNSQLVKSLKDTILGTDNK